MKAEIDRLKAFTGPRRAEIEELSRLGVTLIGAFPEGGPILDEELAGINASILDADAFEFLRKAIEQGVFRALEPPVVVDISMAAVAYAALGKGDEAEKVAAAVARGRVRLQGTDGVRGLVKLECDGDPVLHFGRTGEVSPGFIEVLCRSFARLARRTGVVRKGGVVVVAEDGRDRATGGMLADAMRRGFQREGLSVFDLGEAPTPAVPFAQVRLGVRLGASLTASHNPASQNGIKFFVDGFKVLPEGGLSDYSLSAVAYGIAEGAQGRGEEGSLEDASATLDDFADFTIANLPEGAWEALSGVEIVFDPANGAFCETGKRVFEKLGLAVTSVNDNPQGHNINHGGGVAEIEGHKEISLEQAKGSLALSSVAAIIERAKATGRDVYGLIMDGDGDRGFVVVAGAGSDRALVVDGDAEAFILARWLCESGQISRGEAGEWEFAGTVESDLELFRNVHEKLGLSIDIKCVGDKWLVEAYRAGRRLALGQEVSGHMLWPARAAGPDGSESAVLAGNGLLCALSALAAARMLGLSVEQTARPFERGAFLTSYTYNVKKALFFSGSKAWEADVKSISRALDAAVLPGVASWRFVERADEPDMLYAALEDADGGAVAAVFVRNSGTENKTGIYARGAGRLEPALGSLCLTLSKLHGMTLKDKGSAAYEAELLILAVLEGGPRTPDGLLDEVERGLAGQIESKELESVLYGMRKEGLVVFEEGKVRRN